MCCASGEPDVFDCTLFALSMVEVFSWRRERLGKLLKGSIHVSLDHKASIARSDYKFRFIFPHDGDSGRSWNLGTVGR